MSSPEQAFAEGLAQFQAGNLLAAEKTFRKLLRKYPDHPPLVGALGAVLVRAEKHSEAETTLKRLAARADAPATVIYNHGLALKALGRAAEAAGAFGRVLAQNPNDIETLNNRGTAFNDLHRFGEAIADFDRALALRPTYAAALINKAKALVELRRYAEALAIYHKALALDPDRPEAWLGLGIAHDKLKQYPQAIESYEHLLQLKPNFPFLRGTLLHQRMLICDWRDVDRSVAGLELEVAAGKPVAEPFGWQALSRSPQSLQHCAEIFNRAKYPAHGHLAARTRPAADGRIRIGYVSGEFRDQATAILLIGVLEHHDKTKFEIHAFDNGADDGSAMRGRIVRAVDRLTPINHLTDDDAAAAIRSAGIDILVNLNGYFGEHRTGMFARRPAPVQVNYLGFPGTLGAPYIDYIIADGRVIPENERPFYTEKVVQLPHCYQANDDAREIGADSPDRAAFGLPETTFVFCCFNNNYKIVPDTFDGWMRILARVPGSVLWLLGDTPASIANLRKEAEARGIAPERLVFADRVPPPEHLARHRCADLFLDTLPYNAHTTASDALWAGLPVLTCEGTTFPGRVAASLLATAGLPDLIAGSPAEFEEMAVALANDPGRLAALRQNLATTVRTSPLFDTRLFTKHIEAGFAAMHARHLGGRKPDHIVIAAS